MLQHYSIAFLCAASLLAVPLRAANCSLTSQASPMLAGGLAEPLGDLVVSCNSGPANGAVQGILLIGFDEKLSNVIDSQNQVAGVTVSAGSPDALSVVPGTVATSQDGKSVMITGVATAFDALGNLTLRISGFRAATAVKVQAAVGFAAQVPTNVEPANVVAGYSADSFLATTPDALLQPNSHGVTGLDLSSTIAKMNPNAVARVTESVPDAFHAKLGTDTTGTRIGVRIPALPGSSRLFAPDAIAGLSPYYPTTSGWFGTGPDAGTYILYTNSANSLLLVRVKGVAADGSGGKLAWQPAAGVNPLNTLAISEADYLPDGTPLIVYEVVEANPNAQESAEIPLYAFAGPTQQNGLVAVRAALQLEPVPVASTPVAALPTPRYTTDAVTGPDCHVLGDCTARWFPALRVQSNSATTRILPLGAASVQGFLALTNTGGGVALWSASVDYESRLGGWLRLGSASGAIAGQVGLTYSLAPYSLRPGTYRASVVFTLTNAPDGSNPAVSLPVELVVKPPATITRPER